MNTTFMIKPLCEDFICPKYETDGAACFDLRAHFNSYLDEKKVPTIIQRVVGEAVYTNLTEKDSISLMPGEWGLIPLGFSCALPKNKKLELYVRSGLAVKYCISLVNEPGQVDSDYRGCVCAIVKNSGWNPFTINNADRICQGAIVDVEQVNLMLVTELPDTKRGLSGFGSSGIK